MKTITRIVLILAICSFFFASCNKKDKCAAYSNVEVAAEITE